MENLLNQILNAITPEQIAECETSMEQNRSDASARLIMIAFDQ